MKYHPYANLFPLLDENELRILSEDIAANGQHHPVIIDDKGLILDGRNRSAACTLAGIKPVTKEFKGNDTEKLAFVLSANLHRRHLTTAQRGMVADKLAVLRAGRQEKSNGGIQPSTQEDAAKALNVSRDSVKKARKVREKATPEVVAAVEAGTMSLNAAVKTTKPKKPPKLKADDPSDVADDAEEFPEDETMEQVCQRETSEIESWARKFGDMLKEAQKALSAVPTLDELNARDGWERKMRESLATLRGTKPVVCPICQGDGTEKCPCGGHGRITKQQHGQMV